MVENNNILTPNPTPAPTPAASPAPRADFTSPAAGDITLAHPTKKSKKPLIIVTIIVLITIIIVAIAVIILAEGSHSKPNLAKAFSEYLDYLEKGDNPNDDTVFAFTQVSVSYPQSDSTIATQESYAKTLTEKYNSFRQLANADNTLTEALSIYNQTVTLLLNYISPSGITDELENILNSSHDQEFEEFAENHFFADSSEPIIAYVSQLQMNYFDQELQLINYYTDAGCKTGAAQYECAIREYGTNSNFTVTEANAATAYYNMTSVAVLEPFEELLLSQTRNIAEIIGVDYE